MSAPPVTPDRVRGLPTPPPTDHPSQNPKRKTPTKIKPGEFLEPGEFSRTTTAPARLSDAAFGATGRQHEPHQHASSAGNLQQHDKIESLERKNSDPFGFVSGELFGNGNGKMKGNDNVISGDVNMSPQMRLDENVIAAISPSGKIQVDSGSKSATHVVHGNGNLQHTFEFAAGDVPTERSEPEPQSKVVNHLRTPEAQPNSPQLIQFSPNSVRAMNRCVVVVERCGCLCFSNSGLPSDGGLRACVCCLKSHMPQNMVFRCLTGSLVFCRSSLSDRDNKIDNGFNGGGNEQFPDVSEQSGSSFDQDGAGLAPPMKTHTRNPSDIFTGLFADSPGGAQNLENGDTTDTNPNATTTTTTTNTTAEPNPTNDIANDGDSNTHRVKSGDQSGRQSPGGISSELDIFDLNVDDAARTLNLR